MDLDWQRVIKKQGLYKHWIYKSEDTRYIAMDYLQKASYAVGDFTAIKFESRSDVVFAIVLADWLFESMELFVSKNTRKVHTDRMVLRSDIAARFESIYVSEEQYNKAKEYIESLRSFMIAHPLETTKHKKYGLNGDLIAVDIDPDITNENWYRLIKHDASQDFRHISLHDGMLYEKHEDDCFILGYSDAKDNSRFYTYIGFSVEDVIKAMNICLDKFEALDKYLAKAKKKNFI